MDEPDLQAIARDLVGLSLGDADGVADPGAASVAGFRLLAVSTELGLRLRFVASGPHSGVASVADESREVIIEVMPREAGIRFAAASDRLAFSYRAGAAGACGAAKRLCEALAARARQHEAPVLARLRTHAPQAADAPRIREVSVSTLLEPTGDGADRYHALSPYVGCLVGCRFCYAQDRLAAARRLVGLPPRPWGSWVDARVNAPSVLAAELQRLPSRPIKFCPIVSDPYHAVEQRLQITRRCLEVIAAASDPPPTLVLTRMSGVRDDLERLAAIERAWLGVSIPTADDTVRHHFEPRAASVDARLQTLAMARAHGIRTMAVVQPQLPGDVDALADALAEHADSVRVDVLRGEQDAGACFDAPSMDASRTDAWQRARANSLTAALEARGVPVWTGELPPELTGRDDA